MTNFEKIIAMPIDELTMFLNLWADAEYCQRNGFAVKNPYSYFGVKSWLESEV